MPPLQFTRQINLTCFNVNYWSEYIGMGEMSGVKGGKYNAVEEIHWLLESWK